MDEELSQKAFAERLGLQARQVRNLEEQGLPFLPEKGKKPKRFPWRACFRWYLAFKVESEVKRRVPSDVSALDRREQLAKVRIAEARALRAEGHLVPTNLYRRRLRELNQQYAAVIRSLSQYAPELHGLPDVPAVTIKLEQISNLQLALARGDDTTQLSLSADPATPPAAETGP